MKVRDVIRTITTDGWFQVAAKGGHLHFEAGPAQVRRASAMRRFLIVIEKANRNYSAYAPDLPGCIATGKTRHSLP